MNLPYDYMPKILMVLEHITGGMTESRALDMEHLSVKTFRHYIKSDPQLQEAYAEALQRGYDAMADALLNPDNHTLYGHSDSKMAKVQSDNIKWFLEKRDVARFGRVINHNHNLTADKAITQALMMARNRTSPALEHAPTEVIDLVIEQSDEEVMAELFS